MAQTTNAVPMSCGKVEISSDGITYLDISGETQSCELGEQSAMSGEAYTLSGDTPIIKGGKREPIESVVSILYTEADAEAYNQARAIFESNNCGNIAYLRVSPRGGDADEDQLTSGEGAIISFMYPNLDASTAGPIPGGFTIKHPGFTTTIVSS